MFGIMSWYQESFLATSTAVQLVVKMLDYQKNVYAELVIKELSRANP